MHTRPCEETSFRVALRTAPASTGEHLCSIPLLSAVAPMTGRVLVVEDHALVAIGLQLALSAHGWDRGDHRRTDGRRGDRRHGERFKPECVLLDIQLGDGVGSGIDLIGPLRSTDAKVVMLTAEIARRAGLVRRGRRRRVDRQGRLPRPVRATLGDVLAGRPLIGGGPRAMIDKLRIERAGKRRALSPFERLTMRERGCSPRWSTGCRPGDRREPVRRPGDRAFPDPRRAAEARRALPAGRRRPRQPRRLDAGRLRARRRLTAGHHPAMGRRRSDLLRSAQQVEQVAEVSLLEEDRGRSATWAATTSPEELRRCSSRHRPEYR